MSRDVDAHEVTLLVQTLYGAPPLSLRHRRRGHDDRIEIAEERIACLRLLCLVELSVAYQRVEEHVALAVDTKILLALYAEVVETSAERQALKRLTVDG